MKTCIKEGCENMTEGKLDFCASHARQARNISKQRQKEAEKREQLTKFKSLDYRSDATLKVYTEAKARKRIKKVSDKRKELNKEYLKLREQFLKDNPECKAKVNGYCTIRSTELHHRRGRGEFLLDNSSFLAVCRSCHTYIEAHPLEAKEKGWSESRLATIKPTI